MGEIGEIVCSNDFSRCFCVMASAMTLILRGLNTCLGTGAIAALEGVTWQMPSHAATTEVVTTNMNLILPIFPITSLGTGAIASKRALLGNRQVTR